MGRGTATACYRELGEELRKRRRAAGMSGLQLAREIQWSSTKISRIETGQYSISVPDLIHYLGCCGVYPVHARELVAMCREAERNLGYWLSPHGQWLPDSLNALIYHETTADSFTTYEPFVIPGLLQTADYARAWIAGESWRDLEDIDRCVQVRMERQRVLHVLHPAPVSFYVHELALRLEVGSAAIMHEQLLKLVLLTALDHVTVRVVPSSGGGSSIFGGPFVLFEYARHPPLAYLDGPSTGLFLEDKEYVDPFRKLVSAVSEVALDGGQSRELIATLANGYDLRSERDAGHHLEEEQP